MLMSILNHTNACTVEQLCLFQNPGIFNELRKNILKKKNFNYFPVSPQGENSPCLLPMDPAVGMGISRR